MNNEPGEKSQFSRRVLMVLLGLVLVSLIGYLGYLLRDFQQSLHDIPH